MILLCFPVFAEPDSVAKGEKKAAKWEFVIEIGGYKVYERPHEGSEVKEVKATATYQGTVEEAVNIIFDKKKHPEIFGTYISFVDVLKKTDKCDWVYNIISAPVVSDRDYLVKSCRLDNKDGSVSITWVPFEDPKYPLFEKKVRVLTNQGYFKFTQVEKDKIKAEFYLFTDPGGSLPIFIKNFATRTYVPDSLRLIHKEIMKRRAASKK